jgi:hypothetical protein
MFAWSFSRPFLRVSSLSLPRRHTSEAQSPAPGTGRFEIEWDILEGRERSWGLVLGLSFLCSVVCFVSLLCVAACLCILFGFITSCSNSLFNKNQMISTSLA